MAKAREVSDFYAKKAKQEGYPARSVYKLEEIQQKHKIMRRGDQVLDVGASPGSWTLYVHRQILKGSGSIVAVDLKPLELKSIPDTVTSYTGDACSNEVRSKLASHGQFDVLISDAAPSTTGNRSVDTMRSQQLAESILELAETLLRPGGNCVIKLFQGGGEQDILKRMRSGFSKVKPFKPKASRSQSFEVFFIGLGKTQ
ncbi:MAG: RlmE family RNA methyltransferase [Spirochaetota bacterium]